MTSRTRTRLDGVWTWISDRRGRAGLAAGGVAGLVTGLLLATVGLPLLDRGDDPEPGELIILSSVDESSGKQRQRLIDQWNALYGKEHPARIREVSRSPEQAHAEMLEAGPEVDILNLDVTWTAEFVAADRIRPLDEDRLQRLALLDGFLEEPLGTCRYRGTLYALPFNTDAGLLYYRTYTRDGRTWPDPPASWDDLRAAADEAFGRGIDPKLEAGYVTALTDAEILTVTALEAIWAAGGDVVDGSGAVVIDSELAERGLRRLGEGIEPANRPLILPGSATLDEKTSAKAFADGRALAMRNWPVADRDLRPVTETNPAFRYQVTTVPGKVSVLGGQNLAVTRASEEPRAAQKLIEFLTSERSQQILFEHGGLAATRGIVYRDANVTSRYPYADTLLEAVREAKQRPVTPHYTDFSREFRRVVTEARANDGEITADHARRLTDALAGRRGG